VKSLDNQIDLINISLDADLGGTKKICGLVKTVKRGEENLWIDKEGKAIFFDDSFDHYMYHRVSGKTIFSEIQRGGKAKVFKAITPIDLIVFSRYRDIEEYITSKLAQVFTLTVNSIDYDSYKIFKNETNKVDFDFKKKYIIVVNYQALYYTDKCFVEECREEVSAIC
jgi:hypothetical protein